MPQPISAVLFWKTGTPWSSILAEINAVPDLGGILLLMPAGTFELDVSADVDRVQFVAMTESPTAFGGVATILNISVPLLGKVLCLTNVVAFATDTIWDGAGVFRLNLMGSAELSRDLSSTVPTIKLAAGGVLDASLSQYSLFAGGNDPMVEMDDGSTINFLLTAGSIIGDKAASLKSGATAAAATAGLDSTCVVAGVNGAFGNAFDTGITFDTSKNGNAFFGPYAPTTSSDWNSPVPDNIGAALDQVASRLRAGSL